MIMLIYGTHISLGESDCIGSCRIWEEYAHYALWVRDLTQRYETSSNLIYRFQGILVRIWV